MHRKHEGENFSAWDKRVTLAHTKKHAMQRKIFDKMKVQKFHFVLLFWDHKYFRQNRKIECEEEEGELNDQLWLVEWVMVHMCNRGLLWSERHIRGYSH